MGCVSVALLTMLVMGVPWQGGATDPLASTHRGAESERCEPVRDEWLVLWLDAQDIDGNGQAQPADRADANDLPLGRWADKSSHGNHAVQAERAHQPTLKSGGDESAADTVCFAAARQQFLSAGHAPSLQARCLTAFVVARASADSANMWLFGKNAWGPPWTGFGIAVSRDGLHPWPHLGLVRERVTKGVQLRHGRSLSQDLGIVEVVYDGQRVEQWFNGQRGRGLVVRAGILANDRDLLVGAGP